MTRPIQRLVPRIPYIALAVSFACANSSTAPADVNEDFTLAVGDVAAVAGTSISIKFVGVPEDSRCPINALCIWAGNARVELELRGAGSTATMSVNSFTGAKEVVYGSYRVQLVQLEPFTTTNGPIQPKDYRVTLKVVSEGTVCTLEARPGIALTITDSLSPGTLTFSNVAVVAREGAYRDSAFFNSYPAPPSGSQLSLVYERAGTYELTVRASGYQPWVKAGVVVQKDKCHVITVPISARLAK